MTKPSRPIDIILPRPVGGFDMLAATVLAHRLYPAATAIAPVDLSPGARAFLALHRDRFLLESVDDVDLEIARRVVLVGQRREAELAIYPALAARVRESDPSLDLHVVDNRASSDDDVPATVELVEPVASLVTLLVEALRQREQVVDVPEATLGALGLHQQTRSLTAAASSSRDAAALAWLLDCGASLQVLNRYLRPDFKVAQRTLLRKLMATAEVEVIRSAAVAVAEIPLARPVESVLEVLEEAMRLEAHDAVVSIHAIADDVQVAASSRTTQVDVGRALRELGAHAESPLRGVVTIREASSEDVRERLMAAIRSQPSTLLLVADVMSSPVRCVSPDVSMRFLRDSLATWHHQGVPVVVERRLVGVVSKRDVLRAERDESLGSKVRDYMTKKVETIAPDATLEDALDRMTRAEVGRLPVLRDGARIVGIVSRIDVLKRLYGSSAAMRHEGLTTDLRPR